VLQGQFPQIRGRRRSGGYASPLVRSLADLDAKNAVLVGWSLGGHVILEAAPQLPAAAGYLVFGTAPAASVPELMTAYLPEPATVGRRP
jgi:dienelactone hydrolase